MQKGSQKPMISKCGEETSKAPRVCELSCYNSMEFIFKQIIFLHLQIIGLEKAAIN